MLTGVDKPELQLPAPWQLSDSAPAEYMPSPAVQIQHWKKQVSKFNPSRREDKKKQAWENITDLKQVQGYFFKGVQEGKKTKIHCETFKYNKNTPKRLTWENN